MKPILFLLLSFFSIAINAQPAIGTIAPEITLRDVNDKPINLSSLKGKVVLLDFWASWCGPCRRANKQLVTLYKKLKAKGFEIYSVSIDEDKADWKAAIVADKITWLQVNENGGWKAHVTNEWKIEQIPTAYLLDKKGKIIVRDLEGRLLEKKINELLKQ